MNNQQEVKEVNFTEETAAIFKEEDDPTYMLFKIASKLVEESKEAIAYLGEFTSIVMDDDGLYEESREFYHHSKYQKLESDLFMFTEMMTYMIENHNNNNCILASSLNDSEEKKPVMAFSTILHHPLKQ